MQRSTGNQKLALIITFGLGIVGLGVAPHPALAQLEGENIGGTEEEVKYAPVCVPNVPTGRVRCSFVRSDDTPTADRYYGDIRNGQLEGQGVYVYTGGERNRERYEGQFRSGLPNGRGLLITKDDHRFEGIFKDGNIISGRVIYANGDRYEGNFELTENLQSKVVSSQPTGRGRYFYANGTRYEGQFYAGSPLGQGVVIRSDGTRCEGQFYNQELDGRGTCRFSNGVSYQGEFRNARPHGVGTLIEANGRRISGTFRNGQRVR